MRSLYYFLLPVSLFLTSCGTPGPKQIYIPVPKGCPEIVVADAGKMPKLPIEDISKNTQIDVSARHWKASLHKLFGYTLKLQLERDTYRAAYRACSSFDTPGLSEQPVVP